ncbi:hypothetical protein AQUSIP_01840 [Aquicella siphonis]|uniref:Uncharacterized protein n=1 Tax=Aquicella siphonis TaxID=254247 RepID=A0A5E4PDD4_9COXI|nr:hypothetical protein [Aquicella siphonis]VVC74910.1 hypothetical protein AQUSIP_01840 [Aquicella siphonis]
MSTTRALFEYLLAPVADAADHRLRQANRLVSQAYEYLSSFVVTPTEQRRQNERERYRRAIEPITRRHEQRKAIQAMRGLDEERALNELKEIAAGLIARLDAEIVDMTGILFSYLKAGQIRSKCMERDILKSLRQAESFAEMSLYAEISLAELSSVAASSVPRQFVEWLADARSLSALFKDEDFLRQFGCEKTHVTENYLSIS